MNKGIRFIKTVVIILLLIGLITYVIFAMFNMSSPNPDERCEDVELSIDEDARVAFVDSIQLDKLLRKHHMYPKGKLLKDVNTRAIEDLIRKNEFVENVECYKTNSNKLCINVIQRNPVVYVIPDGSDGYYVDTNGHIISGNAFTSNMVVATGKITRKYATEVLSDFGTYLQSDPFWNDQIEQIYVALDREQKPVVELIPRVGNHVVYLGSIMDYKKKLRRLRIFYEKAMGIVGWNKYERINLEFNNQIVCTKRKIK